jgi:hypothetical protein
MTSTNEATSTTEMQSTREVERKYEAADEVRLPDPSRLLGAQNIGAAEDQQLDAMWLFDASIFVKQRSVCQRWWSWWR